MEDLVKKLKELADEYGMVDVGSGAAEMLGVTQTRLYRALATLCADGYSICRVCFPQVTVEMKTVTAKVLCRPGIDYEADFKIKTHHIIYRINE